MECNSAGNPRSRQPEGDHASTSHDALSKDTASMETNANPPAEGSNPVEKKSYLPSRSSSSSSSHQKPSHSLVQSSHSTGSMDVQPSVFGRSGSSVSAMTVPIRLDALSYLLNNAIMGAYRMLPQNPYYGGSCLPSTCPYQTAYNPCMNQSRCFTSCSNPSSSCQPGYSQCFNNKGTQSYPPHPSCFMQASSSGKAQSGITWNPNGTSPGLNNSSPQQPEVNNSIGMSSDRFYNLANYSGQSNINTNMSEGNSWNKRPSDRFSDAANSTAEGERQTFLERKGFGRFGNKQEGDGWPGRQQRDFGRGGGRGRGDFGMCSWQNTSRNQDRESRFGERGGSGFSQRREQGSPERLQGRGQNFKRGCWSNSRDTGRGTQVSWQQRTRGNDSSSWSDTTTKENKASLFEETKQTDKDEDWETEYPEEKPQFKSTESSNQNAANADTVMDHSATEDWKIKHESYDGTESSENATSIVATKKEPSLSKDVEEETGGTMFTVMKVSNKAEEDADAKSEQIEVEISTGQDHLPSNSLSSTSIHPEEEKPCTPKTPGTNPGASGTDIYTLVVSVPDENNNDIVLEFVDTTDG